MWCPKLSDIFGISGEGRASVAGDSPSEVVPLDAADRV